MDMDPERMRVVSEALTRVKNAFGEMWSDLSPKMKLFYIKVMLELMMENGGETPDMFTLIEATHKELERVNELERQAKLMVLEAKATV
jgi:hypothetical protein